MTYLQKLYRQDITEETVNLVGLFAHDRWRYVTEDIDIPQFKNLSDHAVVVGNGISANQFNFPNASTKITCVCMVV